MNPKNIKFNWRIVNHHWKRKDGEIVKGIDHFGKTLYEGDTFSCFLNDFIIFLYCSGNIEQEEDDKIKAKVICKSNF